MIFDKMDLQCIGLLDWIGVDCTGLNWIELVWTGLNLIELD